MKHIGIVGSRRRNQESDKQIVKRILIYIYEPGDIIISGGCSKGADKFAKEISDELNIPIIEHKADWKCLKHPVCRIQSNEYGKYDANAGKRRNTLIAHDSDILVACVSKDRTGGTEDTIKKYKQFGKNKLILC